MLRYIFILCLFRIMPLQPAPLVSNVSQAPEAPDVASYTIDVRLNVENHRLDGKETIVYHNVTDRAIPDLVFHLYLNAFKDGNTVFMRETGGEHRGFSFTPDKNGWIEVNELRLKDGAALQLELEADGTLARAKLPRAVQPGESITVALSFRAQLPYVFARTGWAVDESGDPFFMVAQWFTKLGVWQETGWNAHPFFNNAEFFADFGRYDVQITLPEEYITGATGMPVKTLQNGDGTQTIQYRAEDVIDFAWTASPNFQSASVEVNGTEILYLYLPEHEWTVEQVQNSAVYTMEHLTNWYGAYPYPRLTLLDVPDDGEGAGGMEYPTLVAVGAFYGSPNAARSGWDRGMELVTVHEVAHQWWQSMTAFNEAEEPWLDEGFADYSTARVMIAEYGLRTDEMDEGYFRAGYLDRRRSAFLTNPDLPMFGNAWDFRGQDYVIAAYAKPNIALLTLERTLGEETMLEIMRTFFERYSFAHPTTQDFRSVAEEIAGKENVAWFFDGLVYGDDTVNFVAESAEDQAITVRREGELDVPTQIEVSFANGAKRTIDWPAQQTRKTYTFDTSSPVQSVLVDPQRALFIELDWKDNDLERKVARPPSKIKPAVPTSTRQNGLAPDVAVYDIEVRLDPEKRRIEGLETLYYQNTTQKEITDLVLHLYLNAFENEETIFMREGGPQHRGFHWNAQENGWIEVNGIRLLDGTELALSPIEDGTLARAALPEPVQPGETLGLELTFAAQLPKVFARTGWAQDQQGDLFFMVGQWFPKPGVWTEDGWNAYPFHANAEFFADFGSYDVRITLPEGWKTGATGFPVETVQNEDGSQTVQYHAEDVIDFAWTASPNFQTAVRQVGEVEIHYLYLPEHDSTVERALDATEAAFTRYSDWYGAYPYDRLTVVDVPDQGQGAGGMEYPTLITAGSLDITGLGLSSEVTSWERSLELVIMHEVGHQWWQSMVAFNEAEEPWLDEGITDYSTVRAMNEVYGESSSVVDLGGFHAGYLDLRRMEYVSSPDVTMVGPAWEFGGLSYGVATYSKPALSLLTLERVLGEKTMLQVMQTFFDRYRFAHPTTEDFRAVAEEIADPELDWFFDGLVLGDETVNYKAAAIDEHSITVEREGLLAIPTDIEVTFADGQKRLVDWDGVPEGATTTRTFTFAEDPMVSSFTIDPQRKVVVDLIWSDNGLRRQPDIPAWLSLFTRLVYRMQDWLLILGGI